MKKSAYKSVILLLTAIILSAGLNAQQELKKEYSKKYTVTPSMRLDLNNRYGDIDIQTSETDRIVIDVKVTLRHPNRERAERFLSYIDVEFREESDRISVKTVFDDKFSFSGWSGDSRRFSIDYNVKMPEEMNLALTNRYGNTVLDDLAGQVSADIKYGNLTASKLSRGNEKPINNINLAYGKGSVEEAGWLNAVLRYCGNFTIQKSQALLLDSRYSKVQIGTTSSVVGDTKYDNLRIDKINNLVLESGYTDINIGTLTKKLNFDVAYGSFSVDRVPEGFESIEVESRYTGVRLGIDESASYKLKGKVSYGGLKFNENNYRNIKRIVENTSTTVEGIIGNEESPAAYVTIDSSYGTIRLN
ncbi:MAG TPA: hypothetical protein DDW27_21470 [Bacteroidales bacterium]|nr:hypothetical protein [Bacteroidales bacterium]